MQDLLNAPLIPVWALLLIGLVALLVSLYRSRARIHRAQAELEARRALHRLQLHRDP